MTDATDNTATVGVDTPAPVVETAPTPAPVTLTVPAAHADLLQRAITLLESGEQWIVDNINAGVTTLEGLFKKDDDTTPPAA